MTGEFANWMTKPKRLTVVKFEPSKYLINTVNGKDKVARSYGNSLKDNH